MHRKQKMEFIRKNLQYLLSSRGETRVSLCDRTGLNRTTIYNILDGRVCNIHKTTVQKVSDFFGISYDEIESSDIAEKEHTDKIVSFEGNMNPCAVPILSESDCMSLDFYNEKIGALVFAKSLTFYYGNGPNVVAVLLEHDIEGKYNSGDLLIFRRGSNIKGHQKLCYNKSERIFCIRDLHDNCDDEIVIIGDIMEERYNYGIQI
ncbi:helix-turn-helix domain-containing protein [Winslowiella toletana]|uniref:helix-turn-helix domain-containing protein n=1 Tax=Winslowiella toletana TaxID=92490 RepID=UPI0028BF1B1C|nr:helix-turn-helix transcriptional regulator [Winslowiella toletana]WNN43665.1 helix-turn-helix transcriptional regulator [Winslowiella toletana]